MDVKDEVRVKRIPEHEVHPIFVNRWSPRAMTGESLSENEYLPLFEAARWAPSSFNEQPWRFIYATRESEHWERLFGLLGEFNQSWCKNAALLCCIVSKDTFTKNGKPNKVHSFDCGSAWENLALEASARDLVVHGMAGFDYEKARKDLHVPDGFSVEAMFALGKRGPVENLPESLREKESPSDRKPLSEIMMKGRFLSEKE